MARIKKAALVADTVAVAHRTGLVVQDPAVEKAARLAWDDVVQAGRSSGALRRELVAAWQRTAPSAAGSD
ncbi:hypothetical protein HN031_17795 [Nocardioides sp. zg-1308]|uniref:hypothetical protein n=1 Tax=Nocardioides sp. zg-1308 TaxID=2736253 RepID=UPI001554B29A|nr:hypothetical protein [Nocardioides sp. zg-1308]NPD06532.1 hypothetical protein [Nocardioides sp. zg-1308]